MAVTRQWSTHRSWSPTTRSRLPLHHRSSTSGHWKVERLDDLLDQDAVQAGIRFPMEELILLDHRAIDLPVLVEYRLRRLVRPVCSSVRITDGAH